MLHPYDAIIAETDPCKRIILLAKEFKKIVVPRAIASLQALLEEVTSVDWKSDPTFLASDTQVEYLGDGWWMCTECSDAFEAEPGVCQCPSCQKSLLARGLQLVLGNTSMFLVPWLDERTAVRVEAGTSFYGFPVEQSIKWTTTLDGEEKLKTDAWVLALLKQELNENGLSLEDIDASTLFDVFPLKKVGGYYANEDLLRYLGTAPLAELEAIADHIRNRFTFLPGGNWCPQWLEGERWDGSPLLILEPAMDYIKTQSLSRYHHWAGVLLGHILAEHDVFEHDERAMSRNMADVLIKSLEVAPEKDFAGASLEFMLSSIERSVKSATCVDYGVDLFALLLHVLSWDLSAEQRSRMITAIVDFSGIETEEKIDVLAVYVETNVITSEQIANYGVSILALPEATKGSPLESLTDRIKNQQ